MADSDNGSTTSYRRAALTAGLLTYGLIVLGGVVRITGSGLGCGPSWPRCDGQWFPPLDLPTLIEIGHRWVAALVTLAVSVLAIIAWRHHRQNDALRKPATVALVLLVVQVLLGPVIVKLDLPPAVIVVHLLNAMALLAVLVIALLRTAPGLPLQTVRPKHRDNPLVHATAGFGFVTILFGALVANLNAGLLCLGFPLCQGSLAPPVVPSAAVHWVHRVLAYALVAFLIVLVARLERHAIPGTRSVRNAAKAALFVALLQVGVGAAMVLSLLPTGLRALHLATGTALWVALVVMAYLSTRAAPEAAAGGREAGKAEGAAEAQPSLARDLVTLTKPRIISLLLVTTVAPMFITPAGLPTLSLVLWVVAGGYLMAGGANAINMWFDRDIDQVMTRTRNRPLPSGRLPAWAALSWGLLLGVIAFAIFWFEVNRLSAWLALGGLLFYVFIYTIWLKRSSVQNIVIGGAAGAFPPLVGWAAMTGRIDLAAIYLFAIVFYWTPPHFWALALTKQGEYGRAGVPMMPVVHGERYTKVQMLVYTLILVPLTIMPSVFGATGLLYGVVAALLGARFLWYCVQLLRETGVTPTAMKMFHYSLLYLALLFVAMGVDRAIPIGRHRQQIPQVIILDRPDEALRPGAAAIQP